jgi:ankyrin repeat protein
MTKTAPIFKAVFANDVGALTKLLEAGTDINSRDRDSRTPLMHATIDKQVDLVKYLIARGADVNLTDSNGWTALHSATQESDDVIPRILLDHGAQVDAQDDDGNTPLSNAVFNSRGKGDLIKLLLSCGANKKLKNKHGVSPLDLAESIANYDVLKFLK